MSSEMREIRKRPGESAIVFLHGFTGDASGTWDKFPLILKASDSLRDWDIFSLGYSTSLLPGTRGLWAADPDLPILAIEFFTRFEISLAAYKTSCGGGA